MERRFFSAKEIANYLGTTEWAVRKWVLRGQIPFLKFGKLVRFDMQKINVWVKSKECAYSRRTFPLAEV
ncbi:MAG: excisionase family DNA-binding protein, partial [Elusimicrobia bacterium]|nr:excisionase family DNA-binding protein [Elusimicrobiota bacterium]